MNWKNIVKAPTSNKEDYIKEFRNPSWRRLSLSKMQERLQ